MGRKKDSDALGDKVKKGTEEKVKKASSSSAGKVVGGDVGLDAPSSKKSVSSDGASSKKGKGASSVVDVPSSKSIAKPAASAPRVGAGAGRGRGRGGGGPSLRSDYTAGLDLPPSDEEEEEVDSEEEVQPKKRGSGRDVTLDLSVSDKEAKKREKKEQLQRLAQEAAKEDALKEDVDAFTVTIGSRASVLDAEEGSSASAADAGTKDIKVENFSVSARGKELLRNASLTIVHGRRYGLVGPNGKGKTTLLKLLSRRQIPVPRNIDVLLVEQEVTGDDRSALQAVVAADLELASLREEEKRLQALSLEESAEREGETGQVGGGGGGGGGGGKKGEEAAEGGVDGASASEKLAEVYEKLAAMGSDSAEARASKILAGLGFTRDMQGRPTKSFSGGWRMRISLARALFVQPTLLLLDEPTNHLDLRAVIWLEEYLMRWKKTLVVVSHDRDFLNSVSTDIIHLFDEKLHLYRGNFDNFEEMYEQKRREMNKTYEKFTKQMKAAKQSGSRVTQEKVKDRAKMAAAKQSKSALGGGGKSKGVSAAEEEAPPEAPRKWHDYTVAFHFPEPTELTPPLLQLIDVEFSYPGRLDFSLKKVNVGVDMGTRVAIVGPNGAGKSTLLNLLAGDLEPTSGESRRSHKLRIGRYSQHFVDLLTMNETAVQYLLRLYPDQEGPSKQEAVRSKLGKFGLPSYNHLTPIVKLSGGQKSRVVFTSISMKRPHILLLDEPTNHLDMQSIDALADALDGFTGGVVLVSHDSRLISRVCENEERSEIWVVDNGTVTRYDGSFEDYRTDLIKEIAAEVDD
ncbi:hypothetical protein CBR_g42041 [Chara braunii]|uniref:ABC transporter domain-containing protein n=1 Tax=Chara braunii TaxID=69332 RepID=A0A388LWQ5_CHABU|nr:hypothetical protein CBR_g42041 [Chara braunii]|eukprot:GBG86757.1 hypothetical protein CBR_g42041 [Chara braunii]